MLKKHYLELIILIISCLSFFISGLAIQSNERFFSIYDYTKTDATYIVDYGYEDYLVLIDEVNKQEQIEIKSIFYAISIDHVNEKYLVYYENDDLFYYGVPMIGLDSFAKVDENFDVTLPKAVIYENNPIVRMYLKYAYEFIKIDSNMPSDSYNYMVFDHTGVDVTKMSIISVELNLESLFRNPVNLADVVSSFNMSIQFFYMTFQAISIIPIIFGFVVSLMFYKMNNFEYTKDMLIKRINGIKKHRLFLQNIILFIMKLIVPILVGMILAVIYFRVLGTTMLQLNSIYLFSVIFVLLLLITASIETRKIFKMSLTRLVQ